MELAGIELRYLVDRISERTGEYYVSNIYGIDRDSLLFKLHHPDKPDILLVLSTMGLWITSVRVQQIGENRLVRRLRSDLLRLKLKKVEQPGLERLVYLTFGGFDREFVLVGEFFGGGNIILCNDQRKVLALQHAIDVRHRSIKVGMDYIQPPQSGRDALQVTLEDFAGLRDADISCARWVGRTMGLPRRYAEGILSAAGMDSKRAGSSLSGEEVSAIHGAAKRTIRNVIDGNHSPVVIRDGTVEVAPVSLEHAGKAVVRVDDFMSGLDTVFTESILDRGRDAHSTKSESEVKSLQSQLAEQEKAIRTVRKRSAAITGVANSMYSMLSSGILRLDAEGAGDALSQHGAQLIREKGVPMISVLDEKIKINPDAPLQSTASVLYGEAKRQAGAVASIENMMAKTRKKIEKAANKTESAREEVTASQVRKRNWFERYRWFYTSDGSLAIGGRDAPSNSAVVRKHLEAGDRVFHAQIFGSPFFILKEPEPSRASLQETAQATVCFSRVWREAMYGASAYWVNPEQVKKSAPSGQYLPKGSFTIEGQRNFVKISSMRLAVGMMEKDGDRLLVCGPVDAVLRYSESMVIIEPTGTEMVMVAKKIRNEFQRMGLEGAGEYTVDDYVRVLPPGKSHIVEVRDGGTE